MNPSTIEKAHEELSLVYEHLIHIRYQIKYHS